MRPPSVRLHRRPEVFPYRDIRQRYKSPIRGKIYEKYGGDITKATRSHLGQRNTWGILIFIGKIASGFVKF